MKIAKLGIDSVLRFIALVGRGYLHLRRDRLGNTYKLKDGHYSIFRETVNNEKPINNPVVLIVGFRLKAIRSNSFFHWLFERLCILTTPFWSGFAGFRVKLWLVDRQSKNYLGIYQWNGLQNTQTYIAALAPVLRFFSTRGSVWHEIKSNEKLDTYLSARKQR